MDVYPAQALPPIDVLLGVQNQIQPVLSRSTRILVQKDELNHVTTEIQLCDDVEAPVEAGQTLGEMSVRVGEQEITSIPIVASSAVDRLTVSGIFVQLLRQLLLAP